jgi:hypothetical protein
MCQGVCAACSSLETEQTLCYSFAGWAWKEERCACEEEAAHGMNEMDFTVLMLV